MWTHVALLVISAWRADSLPWPGHSMHVERASVHRPEEADAQLLMQLDQQRTRRRIRHRIRARHRIRGRWLKQMSVQHDESEHRDDEHLASTVPLNEDGYLSVVKMESNKHMTTFIRRVVKELGLSVRDEGALQGMVPHFSGIKASQTFFALKQELIYIAADQNTWLVEKRSLAKHRRKTMFLDLGNRLLHSSWDGKTAPLNDEGYKRVVEMKSNAQMEEFMRRTIQQMALNISDMGRFHGVVPYYSGVTDNLGFAKLRQEIISAVRSPEAWVTSGSASVLNEIGYRNVAALADDNEMAKFVRRVAQHHGCSITDEASFQGVVPYYSGKIAVQSFANLIAEVRQGCGLNVTTKRYGSMHDVVGEDGVLQITLRGTTRYKYSKEQLLSASIVPTGFTATPKDTSAAKLSKACPLAADPATRHTCRKQYHNLGLPVNFGASVGCRSHVEQAITDSHRRALLHALRRKDAEWTAILEDDVVPLHPGYFDASFKEAWAKVPKQSKFVRLSWCSFEKDLGSIQKKTFKTAGHFRLIKYMSWEDRNNTEHYYTGGCTTGYLVHRSFLPELLGIFPCCCPIDCCLEQQLFYAPARKGGGDGKFRGEQIMINMDAWDSREESFNYTSFNQGGVLVQDNRDLRSLRPQWNEDDV